MTNLARKGPEPHRLTERQIELRNRLIDFFKARKGQWITRERILFRCGFETMKVDPMSIEFFNARIRANEKLSRKGMQIIQSEDGEQIFSMQDGSYGNA